MKVFRYWMVKVLRCLTEIYEVLVYEFCVPQLLAIIAVLVGGASTSWAIAWFAKASFDLGGISFICGFLLSGACVVGYDDGWDALASIKWGAIWLAGQAVITFIIVVNSPMVVTAFWYALYGMFLMAAMMGLARAYAIHHLELYWRSRAGSIQTTATAAEQELLGCHTLVVILSLLPFAYILVAG